MHYREGTIDTAPILINIGWKEDDGSFVIPSAAHPLPVELVAGSSSGTEYVEDVARPVAVSAPSLNMIRDDALSAVTPVENDWIPIRGDDKGALWVHDLNSTAILSAVDGLEASLSSIDTKTPSLGQAVAGSSVPVVLTAAQLSTLTPPAAITGYATETTLSTINTKLPSLGQALAASSIPVVLTAAQISTLTPPAAITGYATETTLSSALTSLQLIDDVVFAQDAATAGGQKGVSMLARQTATPANVAGTDGDYEWLQMSAGRLWVDASGKTLTVGSHAITVASGGIASGAVASGAFASGAFASGAFASGSIASGAIASGAIAAGAIATGATSIAANEDDASANLDTGVKILAIQQSSPADTAGSNADYAMLQMSGGRLWVDASGKTLTVGSHAITIASGGVASGAIASGAIASGAVASGAFASGAIASGAIASGAIAAGAIATGATSIAANEDDVSANLDTGVKILFVQQSTPADTAGTNGDYMMPQMSAGRIWTASNIDKINAVTPLMGNGTTGTGSLRVTIASDNTANSNPWLVSGAAAADAAVSGNPVLVAARGSTATPTAMSADGDVTQIWTDLSGAVIVNGYVAQDAAVAGKPILVGGRASTAVPSAMSADGDSVYTWHTRTGAAVVDGGVAHDGADSGNPVKTGGRAVNAEVAAVANNDRVDSVHDLVGKQIVLPYANPENFVSGAITSAMTGTTSTSLVAAPAAGLRNYITTIIVSNAHATVGTDIVIQDGSGGTTLLTIPAAAVYGGAVITLPTPLRQPTTATAIYCANVTTGASTKVSAVGYKGA